MWFEHQVSTYKKLNFVQSNVATIIRTNVITVRLWRKAVADFFTTAQPDGGYAIFPWRPLLASWGLEENENIQVR